MVLMELVHIWNSSNLKGTILDDTEDFPGPLTLPGDDKLYPYFLIADNAFALHDWPAIFNYCLSRACF